MIKTTHCLIFLVTLILSSPAISSTIVETDIGILHDDFFCSYLSKRDKGVSEIDNTVYPYLLSSTLSNESIQCSSQTNDGLVSKLC